MGKVLLFLVPIALTIYAVIDAIQTEDARVRHLPKLIWILLILVFTPIGAIAGSSPDGNTNLVVGAPGRATQGPLRAPTTIRTSFATSEVPHCH